MLVLDCTPSIHAGGMVVFSARSPQLFAPAAFSGETGLPLRPQDFGVLLRLVCLPRVHVSSRVFSRRRPGRLPDPDNDEFACAASSLGPRRDSDSCTAREYIILCHRVSGSPPHSFSPSVLQSSSPPVLFKSRQWASCTAPHTHGSRPCVLQFSLDYSCRAPWKQ